MEPYLWSGAVVKFRLRGCVCRVTPFFLGGGVGEVAFARGRPSLT
jgi:hypothetical protein